VQAGLPFAEVEALRAGLDLPLDKLAPKLGLSKATLHRRKLEGRLTPAESDRVMRYARAAAGTRRACRWSILASTSP
jgi:uncharacterized protein (DUF2384 family)